LNLYGDGVSSYTIGDIAERSGFSASALRYYEEIGLVEPSGRSSGGYRLYDDRALARLAFIARAKALGCSLEEITDLATIWDGEQCGPVQRRFHDLVTEKIRSADAQIGEMRVFTEELRRAAEQLAAEPVDGPCDADCACATATTVEPMRTVPVMLGAKPIDVPIACTLEFGAMPDRLAEWEAVLAGVARRDSLGPNGLRLEFDAVDVGELARLVVAEQDCCSFFSFALTADGRGVGLEVTAPAGAENILADLFGGTA
jgi:MerR family transcriptional regulator, copper efflux regulator